MNWRNSLLCIWIILHVLLENHSFVLLLYFSSKLPTYLLFKYKDSIWLISHCGRSKNDKNQGSLRIRVSGSAGLFNNLIAVIYFFFQSGFYKLNIDGFSGNIGDSLTAHVNGANGAMFSTSDQDHDTMSDNCAVQYPSGWWHKACFNANLNGLNHGFANTVFGNSMCWYKWGNKWESLKTITMAIRPLHIIWKKHPKKASWQVKNPIGGGGMSIFILNGWTGHIWLILTTKLCFRLHSKVFK